MKIIIQLCILLALETLFHKKVRIKKLIKKCKENKGCVKVQKRFLNNCYKGFQMIYDKSN